LGIVGQGEIGRRVARIARGFRMNILTADPYIDAGRAREEGAQLVDLPTLFKETDFITLHTLLTAETTELIREAEISMMKKSAIVINTSRGSVLDESALIAALKNGRISGAGLDVFQEEPVPGSSESLGLESLSITPHIAGNSLEALNACAEETAFNAQIILRGRIPKNVVNLNEVLGRRLARPGSPE
jgi:phosphoglycerate dehydrogenase-like enzyme